jgi:hypothetical protein
MKFLKSTFTPKVGYFGTLCRFLAFLACTSEKKGCAGLLMCLNQWSECRELRALVTVFASRDSFKESLNAKTVVANHVGLELELAHQNEGPTRWDVDRR